MAISRFVAPMTGLVVTCALAACGDNVLAPADAPPDLPPDAPPVPGCYMEAAEATNDVTAEPTGQTVGATGARLCGTIADDTPTGPNDFIDIDRYEVQVADAGPVLVRLVSQGATALDRTEVSVHEGNPLDFLAGGDLFGGHAVTVLAARAGTYVIEVSARNATMPGTATPYEVRVDRDDPLRCTPPPAVTYTEADDGMNNNLNDVGVAMGRTFTLSPATGDAPEPSAEELAIEPGFSYQVDGVAGMHNLTAGFLDRDTYLVETGPDTNQLDIRLSWPAGGMPSDMDWYLLDATTPTAPTYVQASALVDNPEYQATAVLPGTTHYLWVGNRMGSVQPHDYTIVICGSDFTP
jgi:hypothetical protein